MSISQGILIFNNGKDYFYLGDHNASLLDKFSLIVLLNRNFYDVNDKNIVGFMIDESSKNSSSKTIKTKLDTAIKNVLNEIE